MPDDSRVAQLFNIAVCWKLMVCWAYEIFFICGVIVTWRHIWIHHVEIGCVRGLSGEYLHLVGNSQGYP